MKSCIIFCAGEFNGATLPITENDYIIAADGGYTHVQNIGLTPHCVLGDFDSLGYTPQGANIFPVEKDDTDAMLAVRHGLDLGYQRFFLYGSLEGARLDHTIANIQTLQFLADHDAKGYLIGTGQIVTVVKNGSLSFLPGAEGILSVFCMGADARGVTLEGFQYTLDNHTLSSGFPLGVSNHFTGQPAKVSVENGSLLVIFERKNAEFCEDLL